MEFIRYYLNDTIPFVIAAALIILIIRYLHCKKSNEFKLKREILYFIFYLYLTLLVLKTVIPREFLEFNFDFSVFHLPDRNSVFNNPYESFYSIRFCILHKRYLIIFEQYLINLVLLIPFGFIFPILYKKQASNTVFIGILISFSIEALQLFTNRVSDTFDIFLNTISVIIGYLLYLLYKKYKNRRKLP